MARAALPRLALAFGALLGVVCVLEAGVRAVDPQPRVPPATDARRGAFVVPGDHPLATAEFQTTVHVNASGFVDREWGPRRPGVARVLVLGDSFVQAAQVGLEDGFGRRLEHWLGTDGGQPTEVLSLGVPGAGTATALHLWRQQGAALEPDVVVLGFLLANDVFNNHPALDSKRDKPFYGLEGGQLVPIDPGDSLLGSVASTGAWRTSHLVRWVGRRAAASVEARRRVARGQGIPLDLRVHDPTQPPPWPAAWETTAALVQTLASEVRQAGAVLGVVLFPGPVSGTREGQERAVKRWPELGAWGFDTARSTAQTALAPAAPVSDLTGPLREAEASGAGPLYFRDDGHWTATGHDAAARATAPAVQRWLTGARLDD